MSLINDFLSLIYPRYCEACANTLFKHESFICNHCKLNLPKSNYHKHSGDTPLGRAFSGRVPLIHSGSYYVYEKSGKIQKLLRAIKYQDQKELGEYLGKLYASELLKYDAFSDIDVIIPIPLHKNKLHSRGYNQSEWFAKGLSSGLCKQLNSEVMERISDTSTQTKKKKYERWENVEGIFRINSPTALMNKHVLLVDDVITTGATIEAGWFALKEIPGIKLSVASIAFAAQT
jgi:ComF family protein